MAPIFSHRSLAPAEFNYAKYRLYIREDFSECCAYCLIHETFARGKENFELDHFQPQSKFPQLVNSYVNIYYACHVCNQQKRDAWPSSELLSRGYRFVDTCNENFSTHFIDEDGFWKPISLAGKYTEAKIRLNSKHNVEIRKLIAGLLSLLGESPVDWDRPMKSQLGHIVMRFNTESFKEL